MDKENNELILAFGGTDTELFRSVSKDMYANYFNGTGHLTGQYLQAYLLAKEVSEKAALQGINLSFTGHSLGGGLASYAALLTNRRASTFNASGLNEEALYKGLIASIYYKDELNLKGDMEAQASIYDFATLLQRTTKANRFSEKRRLMRYRSQRNINAYYIETEALNRAQDAFLFMPRAGGHRIRFKPGSSDGKIGQHFISNFCKSLGDASCSYSE